MKTSIAEFGVTCAAFLMLWLPSVASSQIQQPPPPAIQKGEPHIIPGCGTSGCYTLTQICVNVPSGATPISIAQYYDSFSGWGDFVDQQKTPTGFCANYRQHSHNVNRIVSFDVLYQPPASSEATAAAPDEAEQITKLKAGGVLSFSPSLSTSMRTLPGSFLRTALSQLKDEPTLKTKGIEIDDAEFSSDTFIERMDVPFTIRLKRCHFAGSFTISDARLDGSLEIEDSTFSQALQILNVVVKEDLILSAKGPSNANENFKIEETQVEGRTELLTYTALQIDFLKTGDLHVTAGGTVKLLALSHLDVNSLRVDSTATPIKGGNSRATVHQLSTDNSKIAFSFAVEGLDIDNFRAVGTTAGEMILSDTALNSSYDFSFTSVNSFEWLLHTGKGFPQTRLIDDNNRLTNMAFKNIKVTRKDAAQPRADDIELARALLKNSQYSASAYDSLQKLLEARGDPEADRVFLDGHEAKRSAEPNPFKHAWDWFQEYVLGYGRIAWIPFTWSVALVVVGLCVFWDKTKMRQKTHTSGTYSPLWYSFELFVPIVDFGVASEWTPTTWVGKNYSHFHKLAGWVLIPVILAALTGLAK